VVGHRHQSMMQAKHPIWWVTTLCKAELINLSAVVSSTDTDRCEMSKFKLYLFYYQN